MQTAHEFQRAAAALPRFLPPTDADYTDAATSYASLYQHAITALSSGDPTFEVSTPGWADHVGGKPSAPLEYVLNDQFAGRDDKTLASLVKLLGLSLQSVDPAVRMTAQSLAVDFAQEFAKFHGEAA